MLIRGVWNFRGVVNILSGGKLQLAGADFKRAAVVAAGATTCTNPVTQAEGQAIQAKVNEIIAALKTAGLMASS